MSLAGEVVLVTGGAQGIGLAIVEEALEQGAAVSFCDIAGTEQTLQSLTQQGHRVHAAVADVTKAEQIEQWVAGATAAFGTPTVLVNNAGRNAYYDPVTMTEQEWDSFFDLDLKAAWLCARAVLPGMIERQSGSIVSVASIHARMTTAGMFPYAGAKSGLLGLTRSLALEVAQHGVRVNAVSPGLVWTTLAEQHFAHAPDELQATLNVLPMGRASEPREVARVICFLASRAASYVSGAEWQVDGAYGARFA